MSYGHDECCEDCKNIKKYCTCGPYSKAQFESLRTQLAEEVKRREDAEMDWPRRYDDAVQPLQRQCSEYLERAEAAESRLKEYEARVSAGEASDGYHTHKELYEYRMLYNAHAAHGWLAIGIPVVKSLKHSDGDFCFGGGWFIVVATLPTGQVSNHYKEEYWDLFDVPVVELPPIYDGHTPQDAADHLLSSIADLPARSAKIQRVIEAVRENEEKHKGIEHLPGCNYYNFRKGCTCKPKIHLCGCVTCVAIRNLDKGGE